MGCGKLGTKEKVLLGVTLVTLAPIRVVLVIIILLVHGLIVSGRTVGRMLLFVLGFYWIRETDRLPPTTDHDNSATEKKGNHQSEEMGRPGVIISNHVSYLDILYHGYYYFPSFIAKRSVAKIPVVGLTSKCAGCVFVERESKSSGFKGVSDAVTERIRETHQNNAPIMMLFPEGTTTNGNFLLPFKTGAFRAKAPVPPVIIKYRYQRFSPAWDSISAMMDYKGRIWTNLKGNLAINRAWGWRRVWMLCIAMLWNWLCKGIFESNFMRHTRPASLIHKYVNELSCAKEKIKALINWVKPKDGWIKLNTDGAVKGDLQVAWCGGEWLFCKLGRCTAVKAELWGVHEGLKLASQLGLPKIELESDSQVLIHGLKKRRVAMQTSRGLYNAVFTLMDQGWEIKVQYRWGEAIYSADWILTYSFNHRPGLVTSS